MSTHAKHKHDPNICSMPGGSETELLASMTTLHGEGVGWGGQALIFTVCSAHQNVDSDLLQLAIQRAGLPCPRSALVPPCPALLLCCPAALLPTGWHEFCERVFVEDGNIPVGHL